MKLFRMLMAKRKGPPQCFHRGPQDPNRVPLAAPRLKFALRDRVNTKKEKGAVAPALQEIQNVITKLAQNDYNDQFASKEIQAMRDANTQSYLAFLKEKSENRAGVIKPGKQLNPVPLNKYLKRFPVKKVNAFEGEIKELPLYKQKYK